MTLTIEDLSDEQLIELKQRCNNLLNKRHGVKIEKALNKLYSAMEELEDLDPDTFVIDVYDWSTLRHEIKNNYTY